ncbi:MAG: hypothetical protein O9311_08190 [Cytophagales bacterium]|nr:hypothetical protein [Cytophagales bacterium]
MRPAIMEFDPLTSTLIVNAFKFKNNRLLINNKFMRSVLWCQAGKPNLKFTYTEVSELSDEVYGRLFDKGDEDKIVKYLKSREEKELSAREAKRNFDFWMTQTINESTRNYYRFLSAYDHLNERSTQESQLLALENALMLMGYQYRGEVMDCIAPLLQKARIQLTNCSKSFVFNKPKRKKWERWYLAHDPALIPGILVKPPKGSFHLQPALPETMNDLIGLFHLRMRKQKVNFACYEKLLINFVLDNPGLDKKKIFIIDSDRIMVDLFWKGLENINVSELNVQITRKRLEDELKLKVYLPFELICFAVYRFEFCGLNDENCYEWTLGNILVVYDHATKYVLHRAKLTGDPADFKMAVCALIKEDLKIPNLIMVDPQLSGYVDECRALVDKLGLPIQTGPCSNFRLSHFLKFYVTRRDMFIKYMIEPAAERGANTYKVERPKDITFQEFQDRFLELAFDEFNTYDDTGSQDSGSRATPSYCYTKMKKGFSKEISRGEFAMIYYDRVKAVAEGKTCRAKVGEYVVDYELGSECGGKGTLLIDASESGSDGFVLTKSGKLIEAKYRDKFIYEDAGWAADIGCAPLQILDVGKESNRLFREGLGIPPPDCSEMLAQLEKTRVLRKHFNDIKSKSKKT